MLFSSTLILFGGCDGSGADSYLSCSVRCHCWHQSIWRQGQFYFSSKIWYLWMKFKFLCTIFPPIYPCTWYGLSKKRMRWSIFTWITVYVMNVYVDNVYTREDDTNIPKENIPPPLTFPYPEFYPIVVNNIIKYVNTSHFLILWVDVVHA